MTDIKASLTKKVGPLPVYAWGAIIGGGIVVARKLTGGGATGGVGSGGVPVGSIIDADPGVGDAIGGAVGGGGAGGGTIGSGTANPGTTTPGTSGGTVGTGSTGTVGGNGTIRLLKVTAPTNFYKPTVLSKVFARLPIGRTYRVEPVTVKGLNYWRILSTSSGGTSKYKGYLIKRLGGAKTPVTYHVTTTQAA